jgi:hypothetical protein
MNGVCNYASGVAAIADAKFSKDVEDMAVASIQSHALTKFSNLLYDEDDA